MASKVGIDISNTSIRASYFKGEKPVVLFQLREEPVKGLFNRIKEDTSEEISEIVIACPYSYDEKQKNEIINLFKDEGVNDIRLEVEQLATIKYLKNNVELGEKENILIYDLGFKRFSATILEAGKDIETKIIKHVEDDTFGLKEFEEVMFNIIFSRYLRLTYFEDDEIKDDADFMKSLREKAHDAFMSLTNLTKIPVEVEFRGDKQTINVTELEYIEATDHLEYRMLRLVKDMLFEANLDLNRIMIVGGGGKLPQIKRAIKEYFNLPIFDDNPLEATAIGALL